MGIRSFAACFRNLASNVSGSLSNVTGCIRAAIVWGLRLVTPLFFLKKSKSANDTVSSSLKRQRGFVVCRSAFAVNELPYSVLRNANSCSNCSVSLATCNAHRFFNG